MQGLAADAALGVLDRRGHIARLRKKGVRLAQKMQVDPRIPVEIQL